MGALGGAFRDTVAGNLGELREPASATRIVPLYWTIINRAIASGQTAEIAHFKVTLQKVATQITREEIEMLATSLASFRDVKLPPR